MSKNYVYLRVSTHIQEERETYKTQLAEIEECIARADQSIDETFLDIESGKTLKRAKLQELLSIVDEGDTIYTYDQDRLSRDTVETITLMEFFRETNIRIMTPSGPLKFETPEQEFLVTIKAATKKLQRQDINRNIRAGIKRYKQENGRWGRKKKIHGNLEKLFNKYYYGKNIKNKSDLAKLLGVSRTTIYSYMKEKGIFS